MHPVSSVQRNYRWYDYLLMQGMKLLSPHAKASSSPSDIAPEYPLSAQEKQLSQSLMRINHTGEVCAQALYCGQALFARNNQLRIAFYSAAEEETLHLQWCQQRLKALDSHTSYLNPLWYSSAFVMGAFVGLIGDKWSLGFLAETEEQVFQHLSEHLAKLSPHDEKSRAIIKQMQIDEAKHAATANALGAHPLPFSIKVGMRFMATIMKKIVYYI